MFLLYITRRYVREISIFDIKVISTSKKKIVVYSSKMYVDLQRSKCMQMVLLFNRHGIIDYYIAIDQ